MLLRKLVNIGPSHGGFPEKFLKFIERLLFTLDLSSTTSEFMYDNCRVNIGLEHKYSKNLKILNSENILHVPQNTIFEFA